MADSQNGGTEDRRPTPVRMAMEGSEDETEEQDSEVRRVEDPAAGEEWVVRISGRAGSGILPLRVIPLMEVVFSKAHEPEVPLWRAICQGESLEDLQDPALLQLLREARPF
ncbi:MAG: hypothetical protein R6T96_16040 [Longimicrobiales bacterium]